MKHVPNAKSRKAALKQLRATIEDEDDRIVARMAQAMEYGIQWATSTTHDWLTPAKEVRQIAAILRREL